jgi:hypothetical protein
MKITKKETMKKEASFPLSNADMVSVIDKIKEEIEGAISVATWNEETDKIDYQARARIMLHISEWCNEMAHAYRSDEDSFGIVASKSEDSDELTKEAIGAPKAPEEGQFGHGLSNEAMKLLWHYDITPSELFRYDDPNTGFKDIYEGIQAAKAGDIGALKAALEGRFGKKNIFQKKLF